jgi:hypothetical protein
MITKPDGGTDIDLVLSTALLGSLVLVGTRHHFVHTYLHPNRFGDSTSSGCSGSGCGGGDGGGAGGGGGGGCGGCGGGGGD